MAPESKEMSASSKKRRRSSLALFKVKHTDSPGEGKGEHENKECENDTQKRSLLPNPDNIAMDSLIQVLEGRISRLKTEENNWKDYCNKLDAEIAVLESQTENTLPIDENAIKNESAAAYLYPMIDLNLLATQVKEDYARSLLLAVEHERQVHKIDEKSKEMESQYENFLNTLHMNKMKDFGCPKAAIQNILDLPFNSEEDASIKP